MDDPVGHCLAGNSLLLTGLPGTGKTHLARTIGKAARAARRVAAALRRRRRQLQQVSRPSVLRTVMESTAPSCCTSPF